MSGLKMNVNEDITHGLYKKPNIKFGIVLLSLFMLIFGIMNLFPFVFMISSSFKPLGKVFEYPLHIIPKPFILQNYIDIFSSNYQFVRWYANTITMEIFTISLKVFVTGITAYAFARLRFRGRDKLFLILMAAMMIPGEVTLIPRYVVYKYIHITDTMWSMILPYTFEVFLVFLVRQFFMSIPFELSEAAIIDGCNHLQIFYKIILPLSKPAMITMVLFTFVWSWNDYTNPFIFITNPDKQMVSVGIQYFQMVQGTNYALQMAASAITLIPVIAVFLVSQKYFIEGIVMSGIKG